MILVLWSTLGLRTKLSALVRVTFQDKDTDT